MRLLKERGYVAFLGPLLNRHVLDGVRARLPILFRGEFETGVYPDEMHWREGISKDDAPREVSMCNRRDSEVRTTWKLFRKYRPQRGATEAYGIKILYDD